jgi:hypothetical protein
MTAIKARKCFVPRSPSDWVAKVFLTCDNTLAIQFKHGQKVKKILAHGPGAYLGHGGVPVVCCLYPGTQGHLAEKLYHLAQVWPFAGEWVHTFLYKKYGYIVVSPPAQCGDCNTSCSISASNNSPTAGEAVTFTVTITNTDGSPTKGDAPKGTVTISVDGSAIADLTLPDNEPDTQNYESVSTTWTTTSGTHTIEAVYTPSEADFAGTNCSMTLTVGSGGGGVQTSCCPNNTISTILYATISNVSGCAGIAGTYTLTYQTNGGYWLYTPAPSEMSLTLECSNGIWGMSVECPNNSGGVSRAASSAACSPFQVVFSNIAFPATATW